MSALYDISYLVTPFLLIITIYLFLSKYETRFITEMILILFNVCFVIMTLIESFRLINFLLELFVLLLVSGIVIFDFLKISPITEMPEFISNQEFLKLNAEGYFDIVLDELNFHFLRIKKFHKDWSLSKFSKQFNLRMSGFEFILILMSIFQLIFISIAFLSDLFYLPTMTGIYNSFDLYLSSLSYSIDKNNFIIYLFGMC